MFTKEPLLIEDDTRKNVNYKRCTYMLALLSFSLAVTLVVLLVTTSSSIIPKQEPSDGKVRVILVQLNDVYELTPQAGTGGLSRVAGVMDELRTRTPHVFALLAGDVLSPSALSEANISWQGGWSKMGGRQMVDIMNRLGVVGACFGNHEFDIPFPQLQARVQESQFTWVRGNVKGVDGKPFLPNDPHLSDTLVVHVPTNPPIRIGVVAASLQLTNPYVEISNVSTAIEEMRQQATSSPLNHSHALVALTHLKLDQDIQVVNSLEVDLVMGGHEHENYQLWRNSPRKGRMRALYKGNANAAAVYLHEFTFKPHQGEWVLEGITSSFKPIDENCPVKEEVEQRVQYWRKLGFDGFRAQGVDPDELIVVPPVSLDGRSATVRFEPTLLTTLLAKCLLDSPSPYPARAALVNSGSVRIDDVVAAMNPITYYDVLRILPLGGTVVVVNVSGSLLVRALEQGLRNQGSGGFLAYWNIRRPLGAAWEMAVAAPGSGWEPIDAAAYYTVAMTAFLISGKETGLGFMSPASSPSDLKLLHTSDSLWVAFRRELELTWKH